MKNKKLYMGIILLAGILISACQPTIPTDVPPADDEYTYGQDGTIESLEILLLESFPLQAQVIVSGTLPDGCTEIDEITVERDQQEFVVNVITRRPSGDVACTQALVPFEETVDLDIEGLEAGTYTVIAQDQEATFTLEVDNVPSRQIDDPKFEFGSNATVEEMNISINEPDPVEVRVFLVGYVPDGCTEIEEIQISYENQEFLINVVTRRPTGDVMCTQAIVPFEESVTLDIEGLPDGEYTVRANGLTRNFTLERED